MRLVLDGVTGLVYSCLIDHSKEVKNMYHELTALNVKPTEADDNISDILAALETASSEGNDNLVEFLDGELGFARAVRNSVLGRI